MSDLLPCPNCGCSDVIHRDESCWTVPDEICCEGCGFFTSREFWQSIPRQEKLSSEYDPPSTTDIVGFCRWLSRRWELAFEDRRREYSAATSNWASILGGSCLRQMYLVRVGADRKPHSARTMAIFHSGNMIEADTINFMRAEMEIDWIRSQEAAPKTNLNIGSRIDGGLKGARQHDEPVVIGEVKRLNQHEWRKVTDCDPQGIHDLLTKCSWWARKYPYQLSAYINLYEESGGILILREPSSGWAKFVPMERGSPIDVKLWKEIQTRAKYINACVEAKDCPEPIPYDSSICGMCDFNSVSCFPEHQHEGIEVLTHPDVLTAAAEYLELRDIARDLTAKKAWLRDIILATKRDHIMLGDVAEVTVRGDKTKTVTIKRPKGGDLFFGDDEDEDE